MEAALPVELISIIPATKVAQTRLTLEPSGAYGFATAIVQPLAWAACDGTCRSALSFKLVT